jgi:hypothetical protein
MLNQALEAAAFTAVHLPDVTWGFWCGSLHTRLASKQPHKPYITKDLAPHDV